MPNIIDDAIRYMANAMIIRGYQITYKKPTRRKFKRGEEDTAGNQTFAVVGQHSQYAGLRFAFTTYHSRKFDFVVKRQSKGSGYTNMQVGEVLYTDLTTLGALDTTHLLPIIKEYDRRVVPILEDGYPEPYTFDERPSICRTESSEFSSGQKWVRFKLESQIREAEVLGIVAINHGFGTVSIQPEAIQTPNTECMFLIEIMGHSIAVGNIITDGVRYWPTTRITKADFKIGVSKVIRMEPEFGKATLHTQLSSLDQQIVNMAIADWCKHLS